MPPQWRHPRASISQSIGALDDGSGARARVDEEAPGWPRARQDAALDAGEVPPWALYVAFEDDGVMVTFPGWIPLNEGYDARRRPWYTNTAERRGVH